MNKLSLYASAIVSIFLWVGCQRSVDSEIQQPVPDKPLIGTEWDLRTFENPAGVSDPKGIGSQGVLLYFKGDSTLDGRSYNLSVGKLVGGPGSNRYGGSFRIDSDSSDGSVFMDSLFTTEVNPIAGSRYLEYFYALPPRKATPYKIKGNELWIFYDGNTKALRFEATQ